MVTKVSTFLALSDTCPIGVYHQALVDMPLNEEKSLLKDLSGSGLFHCVRVAWIAEQRQQLTGSAGRAG